MSENIKHIEDFEAILTKIMAKKLTDFEMKINNMIADETARFQRRMVTELMSQLMHHSSTSGISQLLGGGFSEQYGKRLLKEVTSMIQKII
jgi:hypothetical protein